VGLTVDHAGTSSTAVESVHVATNSSLRVRRSWFDVTANAGGTVRSVSVDLGSTE
jgi:hypothetical protein